MVLLLLDYISITDWSAQATRQQAEQEWKMFDAVYTEGNKVWQGSPESGWLGRAMRKMAENLLHLAFRVSLAAPDCLSRGLAHIPRPVSEHSQQRCQEISDLQLRPSLSTGFGGPSRLQLSPNGEFRSAASSDPRQGSHFVSAHSSSLEDPTPKRGDMTFALGNICWKVYDQVSPDSVILLSDTLCQHVNLLYV